MGEGDRRLCESGKRAHEWGGLAAELLLMAVWLGWRNSQATCLLATRRKVRYMYGGGGGGGGGGGDPLCGA